MAHQWDNRDDLIVFLVKHSKVDDKAELIKSAASVVGVDANTFKMRISNFNSLSGEKPALNKPAKSTKDIYTKFKEFFG